jgi:ABC-type nickel/cobalt efflux system permease component RcnA
MQIETTVETISFALIATMGAALVASSGWRLFVQRNRHDHDHAGVCTSCGGSHAPSLHQLEQPVSWRSQAGIVLAIGIRPCSGAVLVLLAAQALGMRTAGIAAVASMSLGTALTVGACAFLSTYARNFSLRLAGSHTTGTGEIVGVIGGLVIMLFGAVLFAAGLSVPVHPLL